MAKKIPQNRGGEALPPTLDHAIYNVYASLRESAERDTTFPRERVGHPPVPEVVIAECNRYLDSLARAKRLQIDMTERALKLGLLKRGKIFTKEAQEATDLVPYHLEQQKAWAELEGAAHFVANSVMAWTDWFIATDSFPCDSFLFNERPMGEFPIRMFGTGNPFWQAEAIESVMEVIRVMNVVRANSIFDATPPPSAVPPPAPAEPTAEVNETETKSTAKEGADIAKIEPDDMERVSAGSHSEDFTAVRWFGKTHQFNLGRQANSIRVLWEDYEKTGGLGLHQQTIRHKVDSENDSEFRIDKIFEGHPAFGTMIQAVGKGGYRLGRPSEKPSSGEKNSKKSAKNPVRTRRSPR